MTETPRPWASVRRQSPGHVFFMKCDVYRADEVDAARAADAARLAEQAETIARLRKLAYIDPEHAFEDATYQTRFNELVPENREQAETIRQLQILGNNADKLADREGENRKSWQRRAEAAEARCATLTAALEDAAQDLSDWVKTARGLRERVADPDHDPSTPHLRGILESEQVLTRIYAALAESRSLNEKSAALAAAPQGGTHK